MQKKITPILPVVLTLELLLRHRLNISRAASPVGGQARNGRKMLNGLASQKDQAQLTYTTEPATEPSSVNVAPPANASLL